MPEITPTTPTSVCGEHSYFQPRTPYVDLHKWAESDAEFVRSVAGGGRREQWPRRPHVKVVDSFSCRQMYLKSYTFTKKRSANEKAKDCVVRMKDKLSSKARAVVHRRERGGGGGGGRSKLASCSAFYAALRRLLSCVSGADAAERQL